jgi:predicted nucleotidyltransferase
VDDRQHQEYSRAPEPEDVTRLCRALNQAGARYVLIGGFAVAAYGAARLTKDVDLLVDDDPVNVERVKRALAILTDNAAADVAATDVRDHVVVRVADEIVVDLMGRACGLSYADVAEDIEHLEVDGVSIPVPSPAMLMRTKDTFRPQDALDRAFLERLLRAQGKPGP